METSITSHSRNGSCPMCPTPRSTEVDADSRTWITSCKRHSVPIVALKRHTGAPTAGEWRNLEVQAKRKFPQFRWQRPLSFNHHYYLHAIDFGLRCNLDHALAA